MQVKILLETKKNDIKLNKSYFTKFVKRVQIINYTLTLLLYHFQRLRRPELKWQELSWEMIALKDQLGRNIPRKNSEVEFEGVLN